MVMLHDVFKVDLVRDELHRMFGRDYVVNTWTEENSYILNALLVEKNVMFYLLFFIMIVAAFGIMNSLITFVVQKTREIGVLKALGATRGNVLRLVVGQGVGLAVVGGALGLAGALATTRVLRSLLYGVAPYDPVTLVSIVAVLMVAVIVASWLPARRAAGVHPAEALRS